MKLEQEIKQHKFSNPYQKLIVNLLFTGGWMGQKIMRFLKPYGVTIRQYNILRILRNQNPVPASVNLLIERMIDKNSNVSRIVDKLERKNFVIRKVSNADRRAVDIKITEKGLDLLRRIDNEEPANEKNIKTLSEKETKTINKLLDKLRG